MIKRMIVEIERKDPKGVVIDNVSIRAERGEDTFDALEVLSVIATLAGGFAHSCERVDGDEYKNEEVKDGSKQRGH